MDIQKYDAHVQNLIKEIIQENRKNADKSIQLCHELYAIGEESDNNELLGFASAHLGENYYFEKNTEQSIDYLSRSIKYLRNTTEWELLAGSYNFLGILLQNRYYSQSIC